MAGGGGGGDGGSGGDGGRHSGGRTTRGERFLVRVEQASAEKDAE